MYGKLYYCNTKLIEVDIENIDSDLEFNKWLASCKEKKGNFLRYIENYIEHENELPCTNLCESVYLSLHKIDKFEKKLL